MIIQRVFVFAALFSCMIARGDSKASGKHIQVELVSESQSIVPGKDLEIGIKFKLDNGWHVYWQNPGDSGEPPRITYKIPKGFSVGGIQWPTPEKISVGPLADFGYGDEVLLASTVSPPLKISTHQILIDAQVKWLVCKEVCIPGGASLSLEVPVSVSSTTHSSSHRLFEETRKHLPEGFPQQGTIQVSANADSFRIETTGGQKISRGEFFPLHPLQIDNPSEQRVIDSTLIVKKNEQLVGDPDHLEGILKVDGRSFNIKASIKRVSGRSQQNVQGSILLMIFFAFLGGLLLNLMPCVFPVLSMKVFGFLKMSGTEKKKIRSQALAYTLGILVSFWILVGALLLFKAGGQELGWGFQLQSPPFVASLAAVLFLFGLNLVGIFEIGGSFMGVGNSLARKDGLTGSFFTGVLATIVSTPCTAPFMGAAVGFALSQSTFVTFIIFSFLALGLAFPYLLISFSPAVGRLLPRPGPWMATLKQVTAFFIFATVVWLLSVVAVQARPDYLVLTLGSLFIMGLTAWVLHRWGDFKLAQTIAALLIIFSLGTIVQGTPHSKSAKDALIWEDFTPEKLAAYRVGERNVFVDFTAAWCISCKVNELVVFNSNAVIEKFKSHNVVLLRADWTSHDSAITQTLADLGRSGVPAYAIYDGQSTGKPVLLPEVITPGIVINALDNLK